MPQTDSKFDLKLTEADQKDLDAANIQKAEANALFKQQKLEEACSKYFAAINTIRGNAELAKAKAGKDVEIACRGNLSLCKLRLKDYD